MSICQIAWNLTTAYTSFMSYIIVGLGNPGEEYAHTRHNVGRIILEKIKDAYECSEWKHDKKLNALVSKGEIEGDKITLLEPETFMNKSGASVKPLISSEKKAEKLVVIYDDLDLPLGTMKMSFNRGSGGHKGLESIIKALKTEKFIRIRVGISGPGKKGKVKKPDILGQFKKPDLDILKKQSKLISGMLPILVESGRESAMNTFNTQ